MTEHIIIPFTQLKLPNVFSSLLISSRSFACSYRKRPSSPVQSSRPSHINNAGGTKGVKSVTQYQLSLLVHSHNQHNSNMESIKSSISLPNHKKRERLQGLPKKTSSPSRNTSSPAPKVSSNFIFPNNNSGLLSSVVMPFIESFNPTLPC
jgi:hypothetical protein